MAPSQRFGLAFGTALRQRKTLAEALGENLGAVALRFAKQITAAAVVDNANSFGTLILSDSECAFDVAVALQEAAWPIPLRYALIVAPPEGAAGRDEAVRSKAAVTLMAMDRQAVFCFDLPVNPRKNCWWPIPPPRYTALWCWIGPKHACWPCAPTANMAAKP